MCPFVGQLKIHDQLKFVESWGKFVLLGALPAEQYEAVVMLLDALTMLLSREIPIASLGQLRLTVLRALCWFELRFPKTEHSIIMHLFIHILDGVARWGPVSGTWLFRVERQVAVSW